MTKTINKRTKVIETAIEMFTTKGAQQSSMAKISKESGVAVGTMYLHFKSKDELIESAFLYIKEKYGTTIHLNENDLQKSFEEKFKLIGTKTYQFFTENPKYYYFTEMTNHLPLISEETRKKGEMHYKQALEVLIDGITNGHVKPINPLLLARMAYSSSTALIQLKLNDKLDVTKEMIQQAFDIVLKGLQD